MKNIVFAIDISGSTENLIPYYEKINEVYECENPYILIFTVNISLHLPRVLPEFWYNGPHHLYRGCSTCNLWFQD